MTEKAKEVEEKPHHALEINDVIYKIIDFLDLNDLNAFSLTCKRIRALCGYHFERKYFTKYLKIKETKTGIQLVNHGKYINYFTEYIQNVILCGRYMVCFKKLLAPDDLCANLLTYLKWNCSENLKEIQFEYIHFVNDFGAFIQEHLQNVEIVSFVSCKIDGNIYECFLKYCPKLKVLNYSEYFINELWLTGDCPALDTFYLNFQNESDRWNRFMQQNNNVIRMQTVFLKGDAIRPLCKSLVERALNLKKLCLTINRDIDLRLVDHELMQLCDRDSFEHLEIMVEPCRLHKFENIEKFTKLKKLTTFFFDFAVIEDGFLTVLSKFTHLKRLDLVCTRTNGEKQFNTFRAKQYHFENLEELFIGYYSNDTQIEEIISLFLRNSMKLKTVTILHPSVNNFPRDIDQTKIFPYLKNSLVESVKVLSDIERHEFFRKNPFYQFSHSD